MSAIWSSAQLSNNQYKQVTGMIKTATDLLNKRIDSLKLRVKVLEDINKKYKYILEFDTSSIGGFKSTPLDTVRFLMQIRKQ